MLGFLLGLHIDKSTLLANCLGFGGPMVIHLLRLVFQTQFIVLVVVHVDFTHQPMVLLGCHLTIIAS